MNSSIAFQVLPRGVSDTKTIKIIDAVISLVKKSGVRFEVGPMETTMEGDLTVLIKIVTKAQNLCIKLGADSVFTNVKILYDPKGVMTIAQKVNPHRILN